MFGQYSSAPTAGRRYTVAEALEPLAALGSPVASSTRVGHNRRGFVLADGRTGLVFHQTVVVLLDPEARTLTLADGGFATMGTRSAMDDGLGFCGMPRGVWSAGRTRHTYKGHAFDRTITLDVETWQPLGSAGLPMIRADNPSDGVNFFVEYDAGAKRIRSSNGDEIPADPRRAILALMKLDELARLYHGRFCRDDDYHCDRIVDLFGDYTANAGRNGAKVWVGCHRFTTADVRSVMRRLMGEHPEAAKAARREFLALRRAGKVAVAA